MRAALAAGVAVATGLANVKKILSVKVPGKADKSSGPLPSASAPSSPNFNVVGQSPASVNSNQQVAQSQIESTSNNPIQAYVVSTDITNQQSLDRDIEEQGSI